LKPGRLDADERKIMEQHTISGERICAPLKTFRNVLPIIRSHHEKRDGTGFPDHLKGDNIPLTARVLQTVDIYDSLTTDRPYRDALSPDQALEIMWEETNRGWWDAELVQELQGMLQESPMAFSAQAR
jgi:putative two-component system response regulator